jgi:hypothetical protein
MIVLTIGATSRRVSDFAEIEANWVTHQMRSQNGRATLPSVHVRIDYPSVSLNLSAGDATRRPARREGALRPEEMRVMTLWRERGMDRPGFRAGQLLAFLHQLQAMLERVPAMTRSGADDMQACIVGRPSLDFLPPGP